MDKPPSLPLEKLKKDIAAAMTSTPIGSDLQRGLARAIHAIERAESVDKKKRPCENREL